MTKRTRGTTEGVSETYNGLLDWNLTATISAAPITTETWSTFDIIIQNDPGNTGNVYVGNSLSQSILLIPGQTETLPLCDPRLVYVRAATVNSRVNVHCVT